MAEVAAKATDIYREQADLCHALGHPVRIAIVDMLRDGEQCVCHMEATLRLRQAYISQHLMVLRDAGLVVDRRDGWNIFYRLARPQVLRVTQALASLAAGPTRRIVHRHGATACPCPKCSGSPKVH